MMERHNAFLPKFLILLAVVAFSSCGIEDYIYLAPVPSPSQTSQDEIPVVLPNSDQPDTYFLGYSIYYKIYKSKFTPPEVITSSNFKDINETMATDYSRLAPYLSADTIASINMNAFFNSLNFYPLNTTNGNIVSLLNGTINSFSLQKTNDGFVMNSNSVNYPLVRSVPNNPPFTYTPEIDGSDVINLIEGHTTAYALFFIFAYGVDEYGSSIFSRPTMLGVLQLPNQQ